MEIVRVVGVSGGTRYPVTYRNGDVATNGSIRFEVRIAAGKSRPDGEETSELRWFSADEHFGLELSIRASVMACDLFARRPATVPPPLAWRPDAWGVMAPS